MKCHLRLAAAVLFLLATHPHAAGRFDQKLPPERQIVHVLNRASFGVRAADVEAVRKLGVEKWLELQLHPDRISENPELEVRLKSLGTLQMAMWQLLEKYPAGPPLQLQNRPPRMLSLQPQQFQTLTNGSVEDREKLLASLDETTRHTVLSFAPQEVLGTLSLELRQEADKIQKQRLEERQKEIRRLMPPLGDLLPPEQIRIATRGTRDEKRMLLDSLDEEKRSQVIRALPPDALNDFPDLRKQAMAARQPQQFVNSELIESKLLRAVYSNRQLEEVLVDFWMNHFNIFNGKGPDRVMLTTFERDAIRPYVFGHFKDMLLATAKHPAMLFYLDNWQSRTVSDDAPEPPRGPKPGLNENYARELMELHTLGVDGGYTQADVIEVARAFTGWTIFDPMRFAEYQFNPAFHDRKEKVILGHTIPAMGAEQDGLQVIDILAHHPSTAKFISKELAQRFVADDPPAALVERMADTFTRSDGDLRAVLQTMFSSTEFMSEGAWQAKLKSPLEFAAGALRSLDAQVTDSFALSQRIAEMGEPLYSKVEPNGYPNTGEMWASSTGLLARINFISAVVAGQVPGISVDVSRFNFKQPPMVGSELLHLKLAPTTLSAIDKGLEGKEATPSMIVGLIMNSPESQRR